MRRFVAFLGLVIVCAAGAALGAAAPAPGSAQAQGCPSTTTTATTTTTTGTTSTTTSPTTTAQPPTGHPLNNVTVENCQDGTIRARAKVQVGHTAGATADPVNYAYAYAHDCATGCEAIAAALQVVLVERGTHSESPQNAAVAVNLRCNQCGVFAYAYQYVVGVPKGTRLSGATRHEIGKIRGEAESDVHANLPFAQLDSKLRALAAKLRAAVDGGLQKQHASERHKHSSQHLKESGQ